MRVGHTLFLAASMMIGSWPAQAACLPVDEFARQLAANSPSRPGREAASRVIRRGCIPGVTAESQQIGRRTSASVTNAGTPGECWFGADSSAGAFCDD